MSHAVRLRVPAAEERVADRLQRRRPHQPLPLRERLGRLQGPLREDGSASWPSARRASASSASTATTYTDDPSVANINRSAANTHIYWHGGKLFALKEDSLPYYVDPHTLETLGDWNFNGKYTATTMSAHPKIDPLTGEMIAYGYQAKGDLTTDIAVYTMNPKGEIIKEVWLKSPYLGIIHDIAITQKYVLIPVIARTTSLERLKSGEPMWEWNGEPADDGRRAAARRRSEGRALVQGPVAQHAALPERHGSTATRSRWSCRSPSGERDPSQIRRWTFDLKSKKRRVPEEVVSTTPGILPRMDDRFLSLPYRYGYVGNNDSSKPYDTARAAIGAGESRTPIGAST